MSLPMVRFVQGNLFESQAEALVNTVNCVGVMGKGIAYQFKRAYPEMFKDYQHRCRVGEVRTGEVTSFRERGKLIVNFPTKDHWKSQSLLNDVEAGLSALRALIVREKLKSIAIPPLGCGNGGLAWADVRARIERELRDLPGVDVEVYEPVGQFNSRVAEEPRLSLGHFILAALRAELQEPKKLVIQKAAYFFNVFVGEEYFRFKAHRFGPYSSALDPMFKTIKDYLEFTGVPRTQLVELGLTTKLKGKDADRMRSMLPAVQAAASYCNERLKDLEALATAHAVVVENPEMPESAVIEKFLSWSEEKSQKFDAGDVRRALAQLETDRLIRSTLLGYEPVVARVA
jgi:O-acetyl-ADP-ribose deacetylase (regulator of RNase III)